MIIALDAMGGDYSPQNEIEGALLALSEDKNLKIMLVGFEDKIKQALLHHPQQYKEYYDRIIIKHASQAVEMTDSAVSVVKEKKDASINVAVKEVYSGNADAVVSAGNTGAVMASSLFGLGRIQGIERPPILGLFPTNKNPMAILDIGANVDCKPQHLIQFAKIGYIYAKRIMNIPNPKVALINIGEEEQKGNDLTLTTYAALKEDKSINFIGNIEGKYLLEGNVDVAVCDGFIGNTILKFGEGVVSMFFYQIKKALKQNLFTLIAGLLLMPIFKELKRKVDYDEYGGAFLLGLKKPVIIAHGSASPKAIKNAIFKGKECVQFDIVGEIKKAIEKDKK